MVSVFRAACNVNQNSEKLFAGLLTLYFTFSRVTPTTAVFLSAGSTDSGPVGRQNNKESVECASTESSESCEGGGRMAQEILHVDFEVYGKVQGVFFRKYTQEEGNKLGLRGYCRNTSAGTVSGEMEGPRPSIDKMKQWLQYTGSPSSRISSANFMNEKVVDSYSFQPGFDIRRTV